MRIVVLHGQSHKGSTYHLAKLFCDKLGGEVTEFFLPRDFGAFCVGCSQCFSKSEQLCPHADQLRPITEALDAADVIVLASPVYVYHVTGPMKALLDHYGYRWMVHRPQEGMFFKQAVCLSTAAGAGTRRTNQDLADSARRAEHCFLLTNGLGGFCSQTLTGGAAPSSGGLPRFTGMAEMSGQSPGSRSARRGKTGWRGSCLPWPNGWSVGWERCGPACGQRRFLP